MPHAINDLPPRLAAKAVETDTGCWEWLGWRNSANYGYLSISNRDRCAHRVAYKALVAPIAPGLELDHLCVNPPCINPAHLEPVTHAENQRRIAARQTTCRRASHDWTDPNNVRTRPNGARWCAECDRQDQRRRHAERRASGGNGRGPQADRTHCPHGHAYDEANTILARRPDGTVRQRVCRACRDARNSSRTTQTGKS